MIISFDFDSTLKMPYSGRTVRNIVKLFKIFQDVYTIFIVTSRHNCQTSLTEIKDFCKENGLRPTRIIHTNGELKIETLLSNNVSFHFDDDEEEISECVKHGINCIRVEWDDLEQQCFMREFEL